MPTPKDNYIEKSKCCGAEPKNHFPIIENDNVQKNCSKCSKPFTPQPSTPNYIAVDYKGKHFTIQDELDEEGFDIEDPYVDVEKIIADDKLLTQHIQDCNYYGIPPYLGKDKDLIERIKNIQSKINE